MPIPAKITISVSKWLEVFQKTSVKSLKQRKKNFTIKCLLCIVTQIMVTVTVVAIMSPYIR